MTVIVLQIMPRRDNTRLTTFVQLTEILNKSFMKFGYHLKSYYIIENFDKIKAL